MEEETGFSIKLKILDSHNFKRYRLTKEVMYPLHSCFCLCWLSRLEKMVSMNT